MENEEEIRRQQQQHDAKDRIDDEKEGNLNQPPQSPPSNSTTFPHTILMEDGEGVNRKVSANSNDDTIAETVAATVAVAGTGTSAVESMTVVGDGDESDNNSSLSDGSVEDGNPIEDEDMDMSFDAEVSSDNHIVSSVHPPQSAGQPEQTEVKELGSAPFGLGGTRFARGGVAVIDDPKNSEKQATRQQQQQKPHIMSIPPTRDQRNIGTNSALLQSTIFERSDSSNDGGSSGSHRNGASSQTSSRDWGWFEDVHMTGSESVGAVGMMMAPSPSSSSRTLTAQAGGGRRGKNQKRDDAFLSSPHQSLIHHTVDVNDEDAAAVGAVTAPTYVLEESLSSQKLWKHTAGNRPPQPVEERAFFEKMWAQNFARSQVNYSMPVEVLTAASPISLNPFADGVFEDVGVSEVPTIASDYGHYGTTNGGGGGGGGSSLNTCDIVEGDAEAQAALISRMHYLDDSGVHKGGSASYIGGGGSNQQYQKVPGTKNDGDLTILLRGTNAFGTTVSKSFARSTENGSAIVGVDTVNISLASYRVVESKKHGKYAQFLVIYREGSIRDTVGVWKRYRDFEELSHKVTQAHEGCAAVIANMSPLAVTEEPDTEHLPNAITSWRLLKKRKRWYRCLDAAYLSLKVFLLERFLHDILFESSSPKLLRDFVLGTRGSPE